MKSLNRWVYAIIGVIVLLLAGLVYAWTNMAKPIGVWSKTVTDGVGWSEGQLSMCFTLVMAFFCIGCLIAGFLIKKVNPKIFVIISGVLFIAGFMVATLVGSTPAMLYLGYGVMCGLGAGFAYNAVMSTISAWFPDKQGLISGILLMGFGLSGFIVAKIYKAMTATDGSNWMSTFRIFGIVIVIVMVICSFFFARPGADFNPPAATKKKEVREPALDINTGAMVKKPAFWLYYIWAVLISAAGLVLVSQGNGIASQVGSTVNEDTIVTVVGLISIMNGVGRIFFGGLFDRKGYRFTMILDMIVFIIAELVLVLALKSGNFAFIVIGFVIGGFAYSGVTPTNSAIISDFFGRTNYPLNFSLINTNLLIASFASTIAGRLYDSTSSYMAPIIMMIGVTIVGFIVFLGIRRPNTNAK